MKDFSVAVMSPGMIRKCNGFLLPDMAPCRYTQCYFEHETIFNTAVIENKLDKNSLWLRGAVVILVIYIYIILFGIVFACKFLFPANCEILRVFRTFQQSNIFKENIANYACKLAGGSADKLKLILYQAVPGKTCDVHTS